MTTPSKTPPTIPYLLLLVICAAVPLIDGGCRSTVDIDHDVAMLIQQRQREALGYQQPITLEEAESDRYQPDRESYKKNPHPSSAEMPDGFDRGDEPIESKTTTGALDSDEALAMKTTTSRPTRFRMKVFTLTDALAFAQQHRREYQNAKEDLYLATLALTLEQHLWTPQFAADLKAVYGNYGEITDFDQATRFVADLSVAQRLPYGGQFTAAMVSTLIRDVGKSITASEGSQIVLGMDIPLLRNAGHVARENLIQLERDLTYAVRSFERFRRQQLVLVAQDYFDLLVSKQAVLDATDSLQNAKADLAKAIGFQRSGRSTVLETGRARTRVLDQENSLAIARESFRASTDRFKIMIGMPVVEPIGLDDLETIEEIEQQVADGKYPLLQFPPAGGQETRAVQVATNGRLDLLTARDRIDDAKRGVAIAKNALLPDLDWTSSLTYNTDPEHYKLGAFEQARATWRSEVLLSLNDRFRERNTYRSSLIDVNRARRSHTTRLEQITSEVRSAVNQIQLQEQLVLIQQQKLDVKAMQRDYARDQYDKGNIDNRDMVEAEDDYVRAQNALNRAKASRWSSLLDFRLATETLRIDQDGVQQPN